MGIFSTYKLVYKWFPTPQLSIYRTKIVLLGGNLPDKNSTGGPGCNQLLETPFRLALPLLYLRYLLTTTNSLVLQIYRHQTHDSQNNRKSKIKIFFNTLYLKSFEHMKFNLCFYCFHCHWKISNTLCVKNLAEAPGVISQTLVFL